jgi:hypothetical protein
LSTDIQLAVRRGFEEWKPLSGRSRVLIFRIVGPSEFLGTILPEVIKVLETGEDAKE